MRYPELVCSYLLFLNVFFIFLIQNRAKNVFLGLKFRHPGGEVEQTRRTIQAFLIMRRLRQKLLGFDDGGFPFVLERELAHVYIRVYFLCFF